MSTRKAVKPITIVFTGGHHNSSLVLALELKNLGYRIIWFGHKFTMRGDKQISAEYQEVTKAGINFQELKTGKIYRKKNPTEYLKVIFGFFQAFNYLLRFRPKLIISSGGYLAVPVVISGYFLGISSVTHEQTVTAGWANKAIAPFVKKIFLTHKSSLVNYPRDKAIVVGLPLRKGLLAKQHYKKLKRPLIYITCGKQGSHIINQVVFPLIPKLVEKYKVVHQTGAHTSTVDQDRARRVKATIPKIWRKRYHHSPYYFERDAIRYLKTANLVISRAGAHTTYELLLLNKRSILIPIPWVSHNEQGQNAALVEKQGLAVIIKEENLTTDTLEMAIRQAFKLKITPQRKPPVVLDATSKMIKALMVYLK